MNNFKVTPDTGLIEFINRREREDITIESGGNYLGDLQIEPTVSCRFLKNYGNKTGKAIEIRYGLILQPHLA